MKGTEPTYQLIANIISKSYPTHLLVNDIQKVESWDELVIVGSDQLLLPLIYWSLKKKEALHLLPKELSEYLREIHQINLNRNKAIIDQVNDLCGIFEEHSINYVLIKGAAFLIQLKGDQRGIRMVGDIDVLVDLEQVNKVQNLLFEHGYELGKVFNYERQGFRHLNRMVHNKFIAAVEIHSKLFNKRNDVLPPIELINNRRAIETYQIPCKDHMIINSILSTQINDHGQYYRRINFKPIYDCLILELPVKHSLKLHLRSINEARYLLATAQYFFHDFDDLLDTKLEKKWSKAVSFNFRSPKWAFVCYKIKRLFREIMERIEIFLNNPSYRRHVLKNKIFPIFN